MKTESSKDLFCKIKKEYNDIREEERKKIVKYFIDKGYEGGFNKTKKVIRKLSNNGGKGVPDYGKNRFKVLYNLRNWKFVEISKKDKEAFISLQAFDKDPKSKNIHVLMDRLGIYVYDLKKYNADDAFHNMINTDIDLPIDDVKLKKLEEMIKKEMEK